MKEKVNLYFAVNTYGGVSVQFHVLVTSKLDPGELNGPAAIPSGKRLL
jgi:hypothetical protein